MRKALSRAAIALPVIALFVAALRAPGQAPAGDPPSDNVLASVPVPKHPDILLLPVELEGKKFSVGLFTSASFTIYDSSLIPLLGSENTLGLEGRREDRDARFFSLPPAAKLGALSLGKAAVVAMNLQGLRDVTGEDVFGIIGTDFLGKHVVRIDPDRGEVSFLRSPGRDAGERIPLHFERWAPYAPVHVSGMDGTRPFMVDTGLGGVTAGQLQMELFYWVDRAGKVHEKSSAQETLLGNPETRRIGKLEAVSLGGFRHENLLFRESGEGLLGMNRFTQYSEKNVLGLNYLTRYVVTFDFSGRAMYLKKGERFAAPDVADGSGLNILRHGGFVVVKGVEKGSAAEATGVRPEDVIVSVDGKRAGEWRLSELRRYLCGEGKSVRLAVGRDGTQREMVLTLRVRQAPAPVGN